MPPAVGRLQSINGASGIISHNILATPTPAGTVFRKSPPPSLLGTLSPSPLHLDGDGDEQAGQEFGPDGQEQQEDGPGGGGGAAGRRRKQCLSARERNVRRIESNEREWLRMHGLNEAFQVSECECRERMTTADSRDTFCKARRIPFETSSRV